MYKKHNVFRYFLSGLARHFSWIQKNIAFRLREINILFDDVVLFRGPFLSVFQKHQFVQCSGPLFFKHLIFYITLAPLLLALVALINLAGTDRPWPVRPRPAPTAPSRWRLARHPDRARPAGETPSDWIIFLKNIENSMFFNTFW